MYMALMDIALNIQIIMNQICLTCIIGLVIEVVSKQDLIVIFAHISSAYL